MRLQKQIVVPANGEASVVRFPKGMLKKLSVTAANSGRSRNSEIVYRLLESLKKAA